MGMFKPMNMMGEKESWKTVFSQKTAKLSLFLDDTLRC